MSNDAGKTGKNKSSSEKQTEAGCFAAGGALGGAATCALLGNAGLAIAETAVGVGILPFAVAGGVLGLAAYGFKSIVSD